MLAEANDFLDESNALHALIADLDDNALETETAFKNWTINDVVAHLHVFNELAALSLTDEEAFAVEMQRVGGELVRGVSMQEMARARIDNIWGAALRDEWRKGFEQTATVFGATDPSRRVKWFGPDMSVRSSVSARLMETWAHGQEVYDVLGARRKNADRIRAIVHLGVNTYGWTFKNRGEEPPEPAPYVKLVSPTGAAWEFNDPSNEERIEGEAEEFCQVVTQTRNIADTGLDVKGSNARAWMAVAQCFAGPPVDPPAPGTRKRAGGE